MQAWCKRLTESPLFQNTITALIVINGVVLGLETSENISGRYGGILHWTNNFILGLFVVEVVLKLVAACPRPQDYFRDGWNVFDFSIVTFSLLPFSGEYATIARLLRLLRVMRLLSALPELRLIISTVLRTIPSMGHVVLLLSVLFYIYGVAGYHAFHEHDPTHWRTLGIALLTLFRIVTLEDWTDVMYAGMDLHPMAWIYFVSFVVLGTFMVLNLFIAILLNNLDEAKAAEARESISPVAQEELLDAIRKAQATLEDLQARMIAQEKAIGARDGGRTIDRDSDSRDTS